MTALPLGVAFTLGRKAATRRYTYGYGRAEDLAGIAIIAIMAASAVLAGYEAISRLLHPQHVSALPAVAGVPLGWGWADPAAGLLITAAIIAVLRQAAVEVYRRLMDAEHQLLHAMPRLSAVLVHADPHVTGSDPHEILAAHRK